MKLRIQIFFTNFNDPNHELIMKKKKNSINMIWNFVWNLKWKKSVIFETQSYKLKESRKFFSSSFGFSTKLHWKVSTSLTAFWLLGGNWPWLGINKAKQMLLLGA